MILDLRGRSTVDGIKRHLRSFPGEFDGKVIQSLTSTVFVDFTDDLQEDLWQRCVFQDEILFSFSFQHRFSMKCLKATREFFAAKKKV